jgi:hypothetical protein
MFFQKTSPDDYLEITKEGTVRTNKPIKRVTITGVHLNNTSDSSGKRNDVSLSKNKVDSTHKKQEVKDVVKNKKSFRPSFLLTISRNLFSAAFAYVSVLQMAEKETNYSSYLKFKHETTYKRSKENRPYCQTCKGWRY